jgi:hypothetical protein
MIEEFLNFIIKNNIKGEFDIINKEDNKENFVINNNFLEVKGEEFDINILRLLEDNREGKFVKEFNNIILEFYNNYYYRDILNIIIK